MDETEARDFGRRYQDTYIRYRSKKDKDWTTVYIHSAAHAGQSVVELKFENNSGDVQRMLSNTIELNLDFPETGYVQHGGRAYYMQRAPHRQWKWGLAGANSFWITPFSILCQSAVKLLKNEFLIAPRNEVIHAIGVRHILDLSLADAIFNRKFSTFEAAIGELKSGKNGMVAIDRTHAVSVSPDKPCYLLWVGMNPVADINKDNPRQIKCHGIFKQEVMDYFARQGRLDIHVQ